MVVALFEVEEHIPLALRPPPAPALHLGPKLLLAFGHVVVHGKHVHGDAAAALPLRRGAALNTPLVAVRRRQAVKALGDMAPRPRHLILVDRLPVLPANTPQTQSRWPLLQPKG